MNQYLKIIIILTVPFLLLGCSVDAEETADPTLTTIQGNIIGSWISTNISTTTVDTWQFIPDGTFIDPQGVSFQYEIHQINGFTYMAYNAEEINVVPSEELAAELENSLGGTDFIPLFQITMPSNDSIIIEPATRLYGSDTYFGITFPTYVLRRQ